jgi:citrate lyase beta subunit
VTRHFAFLSKDDRERLFFIEPGDFDRKASPDLLAIALGATLYSPATRPDLSTELAARANRGLTSAVLCLEDAVPDTDVLAAESHLIAELTKCATSDHPLPLLFVRVRTTEQIELIAGKLGEHAGVLTGFVVPKFTPRNGAAFMEAIAAAGRVTDTQFYVMPVLESPEIIHHESRREALLGVRDVLAQYRDSVLAVRIGATDFSSVFGLRRSQDLTIYDVLPVAGVISDIVNTFGRSDGSGYPVVGPVWEYFPGPERMFKPQLRESPFRRLPEGGLRDRIIAADLDGLIREVVLDKANGLIGKTVIHPAHVVAVHALLAVTHEEYSDAQDILDEKMVSGGVAASQYQNKMNEAKPHRSWAHRIMRRAEVFGTLREDASFAELLDASGTA